MPIAQHVSKFITWKIKETKMTIHIMMIKCNNKNESKFMDHDLDVLFLQPQAVKKRTDGRRSSISIIKMIELEKNIEQNHKLFNEVWCRENLKN